MSFLSNMSLPAKITLGVGAGLTAVGSVGYGIWRYETRPTPLPTISFEDDATRAAPENPDKTDYIDQAIKTGGHIIVAHRGDTTGNAAPTFRNTIGSLDAAAADGASDAVEMDISTLGDGTLVVFHPGDDPTIKTIGQLHKLTKADLAQHPQIPTLAQWAAEAGRLHMNVLAEFKDLTLPGDTSASRDARVGQALSTLEQYVDPQHLATYSFQTDELRTIHAIDPSVPTGLITRGAYMPFILDGEIRKLGYTPTFVYTFETTPSDAEIADMHARGIGVMAAGSNASEAQRLLTTTGSIGVMSNDPVSVRTANPSAH